MRKLILFTAFFAGYFVNDVVGEFAPIARAEVAGMDYRDLRRDRDFKKAVRYVVENCGGSGYGQIESGSEVYIYTLDISC